MRATISSKAALADWGGKAAIPMSALDHAAGGPSNGSASGFDRYISRGCGCTVSDATPNAARNPRPVMRVAVARHVQRLSCGLDELMTPSDLAGTGPGASSSQHDEPRRHAEQRQVQLPCSSTKMPTPTAGPNRVAKTNITKDFATITRPRN